MTFTQKLIQFIANHWAMVGGFVILLILLFIEEARSKGLGGRFTVQDAVDQINREEALVLDIRESSDFKNGHIVDARNIPMANLEKDLNKIKAFKKKPVIVVCYRGQSSLKAVAFLSKQGFEKVRSLTGGMQAWKSASMPVKKEQ